MPLAWAILLSRRWSSPSTRCSAGCGRSPTPTPSSSGWSRSACWSRSRSSSTRSAGCRAAGPSYVAARPGGRVAAAAARRPAPGAGPAPSIVNWWDVSLMLVLGGIPWNCYFQRVLSCQTPAKAQWHSILAGLLTIGFTVPAAAARRRGVHLPVAGRPAGAARRAAGAGAADDLPAPGARLGRAARPRRDHRRGHLELPRVDPVGRLDVRVERRLPALAAGARARPAARAWFAWRSSRSAPRPPCSRSRCRACRRSGSSRATWSSCCCFRSWSFALFDRRANRIGSMAAFGVSLVLRLGGGEPLFGIPPLDPVPASCSPACFPGRPRAGTMPARRAAVPVQDAGGCGRARRAAGRVAADRALGPAARAAERARRGAARRGT